MVTFVLIMVGIVLPALIVAASVVSARGAVRDRNAAQRALRGAYVAAGVEPPSGL